MINPTGNNKYDCPFGIANQKEIEKANDRNSIMIKNFEMTVKQLGDAMNNKFDELNNRITDIDTKIDFQNEKLEKKIEKIDSTLEKTIEKVVENKFKNSVFGLVKWVSAAVVLAILASVGSGIIFPFLF